MQNYKANPGQLLLRAALVDDTKTRVLCYAGARAGKTFEFVRSILLRAIMAPGSRHAIIRKHFNTAKKFIWLDTLPAVVDLCFPEIKGEIEQNKSDYFYKLWNGSEIWIGGLDDKDRADKILGGEYNTIFFNECSEKSYQAVSTALTRLAKKTDKVIKGNKTPLVNKAYFDTNPPTKGHWSYKLFFDHIDPETRIGIENTSIYSVVHIRPEDNLENLPEDFIEQLRALTGARRKRFYEGVYQDAAQGALWTEKMINQARGSAKDYDRVVVAIDPAVTKSAESDETGIVVVGKKDKDYYVLDDISGFYSPNEWAQKAISAYDRFRADRVIGEVNNGGDMIESIISNNRRDVSYRAVHATRGKMVRAEPIAALYEKGQVHHTREFIDLEYQMTTYTGKGDDSPDRMDALVWAITFLMGEHNTEPESLKGIFY